MSTNNKVTTDIFLHLSLQGHPFGLGHKRKRKFYKWQTKITTILHTSKPYDISYIAWTHRVCNGLVPPCGCCILDTLWGGFKQEVDI